MTDLLKGTVIRSTGSWNTVLLKDGTAVECKLRGQFRMKGSRSTNPITVGDRVCILKDELDLTTGTIEEIEPRKNYVIRKSVNLSKESHIIAANMDRAMIVATVKEPRTSYGFIDRFLCTAEAYTIPAIVVLNKNDLIVNNDDKLLLNDYIKTYQLCGYEVIVVSAESGENMEQLRALLRDKTTLLGGHSGVGKSTLINALQPKLDLKTGEISEVHHKGKHTTTFAEMFELEQGGFIIDTPGIKEFGMIDMEASEVSHYFPEMFKASDNCRFNNCMHINEPGCAVKTAVNADEIPSSRYSSYLSIFESIQ